MQTWQGTKCGPYAVSKHVPPHAIQLVLAMGHMEMGTVRQQDEQAYGA
jgi:hypothetical protein